MVARVASRNEKRTCVWSRAGFGPSEKDSRARAGSTEAAGPLIENAALLRSLPRFPAKSRAETRSHAPAATEGPVTGQSKWPVFRSPEASVTHGPPEPARDSSTSTEATPEGSPAVYSN